MAPLLSAEFGGARGRCFALRPVGNPWETRGKTAATPLPRKARTQKKVLSLVLCVAMMLSVMVMSTGAASFTDQDEFSDNYAEAAEVLTGMGVINGYGDGSFQPQQTITRAEVAAMIYRVATGDVDNGHPGMTAGANYFTDVHEGDWYAGYVNYCADAGYIKGFEDNTFRANDEVTGYQVLAMILRAVGYDKNNEYTGLNWTLNVASTAMDLKLLKNVDSSVSLTADATRELVAEFIFQAIRPGVNTVHFSDLTNTYVPDKGFQSLGERQFDLAVTNEDDAWGRPSTVWYANNEKYGTSSETIYADLDIAPVATYTTAVNDCDVYEDTGISGKVNTYVNGQETTYDISKIANKDPIGAQGQLVEVYDYTTVNGDDAARIVVIDTFLAQVTDVVEAKYDANNHLAQKATLKLAIYDGTDTDKYTEVTLTSDTNYTYAVGDMLLVNAYADSNGKVIDTGDAKQHVEIVSAAESFVGAQTRIHSSANYHTVNGTDYPDAFKFIRDDAGTTEDYNFNWWQDQYGNLIGVTGITSNYAVLKDMIWIQGTPGYAQATLVYMDGTEATVTVDSIDEFGASDWESLKNGTDTTPSLSDGRTGFGLVSTDSSLNGDYEGYAMYRVDTNSDGSVNLEGTEVYPPDAASLHIEYADDVTLNINASAIVDVDSLDVITHVSNSTQFLLKNGDTYTAYTGTANLPDFNWETVEVFYDDEDGDNVADYVYIKSYSDVHGMYVFATSASSYIDVPSRNVVTLEDVYVDGELTEVTTTRDLADKLIRNLGKLYYATWNTNHDDANGYGLLQDITLVSENTDNDVQVLFGGIANYLNENIDEAVFTYTNGTLVVNDRLSYNVGSTVEVIYTNDDVTYTMNLADVVKAMKDGADYGLWIVGNRYDNAVTVYAGTELEEQNDISVQGDEGLIVPKSDEITNNTYNVKINDKNANGALDLTVDMLASSEYASFYVQRDPRAGESESVAVGTGDADDVITLDNVQKGDVYKVWVTTECNGGCTNEMWTITIDGWNIISKAITEVTYNTDEHLGNAATAYYDYGAAVKAAEYVDVDGKNGVRLYIDEEAFGSEGWPVYVKQFSSTGNAAEQTEAQFLNGATEITTRTGDTHGSYYWIPFSLTDTTDDTITFVIGFTPSGEPGELAFVAYEINNNSIV